MNKILLSLILALFFLPLLSSTTYSQSNFVIEDFHSEVTIEQDTGITVKETIVVRFLIPRHGIFRDIPYIYPDGKRTIKADFKLVGVTDELGNPYKYELSTNRQMKNIKIGDPNKLVEGKQIYVVKYYMNNILQEYEDHIELYWNVTGHEWQSRIDRSSATIISPYAEIRKVDCFSGRFGSQEKYCTSEISDQVANLQSTVVMLPGGSLTVVIALDKDNQLIFPGFVETLINEMLSNLDYVLAFVPFLTIFFIWYKRGRDKRYISDNIYYQPDDREEKAVSIFERKFLPLVYYPIDDLTPSEAGTIIDDRVDINDVISEIIELARLGYLEIQKLEKKGFFKSSDEYAFIKTAKTDTAGDDIRLSSFQKYLLKEIFRKANILRSVKEADKIFKGQEDKLAEARKKMSNYEYVLLSGLKNHFYEGLPVFRDKLYRTLDTEEVFHGNPEKVRQVWGGLYILIVASVGVYLIRNVSATSNITPLILATVFSILGIFFALSMPRRSAKGYSLKRQLEGLKWYLEKGKWRHEFAEKNLFIEEMLPFAIALGVVDKLVQDMKELGIKPPSYFAGATISSFTRDLNNFSSSTSSSLTSSPKSSGSSSWSGGSGFSGGSSGGGFGGGGGGSW